MERINIPVWEKITLSIDEAVAYSGIERDRLYHLCEEREELVLHIGKHARIKRKELEKFVSRINSI